MSFILLGILNSQASGGAAGSSYELIETKTLGSNTSSIEFTSIPQDYKHLQLRAVVRSTRTDSFADLNAIRVNSNSGSIYDRSEMAGAGSNPFNQTSYSQTSLAFWNAASVSGQNNWSAMIVDLLDYSSDVKNTNFRLLHGYAETNQNDQRASVMFGQWRSTSAVTSLRFFSLSYSLLANSRFSLYGIRG